MTPFWNRKKNGLRLAAALLCLLALPAARAQHLPSAIPGELENIYTRGLNWLLQNQDAVFADDGTSPALAGLCAMAMLARGEDPNFGPYAKTIRSCLEHILKHQNPENGYIGTSMYNHGFAAAALAEAYGAVAMPGLGKALRKAVDLILTAQKRNPLGAWRYDPTSSDADTTVSGAQMLALFAARNAGLPVPQAAIRRALNFYDSMRDGRGGYGYDSPTGANHPRTAIGVLVFALARKSDFAEFRDGVRFLTRDLAHRESHYAYYYEYYLSQALFQADYKTWQTWNRINVRYMASQQKADGSWSSQQGEAFATTAALLSLALNYRFLPIYER